MKRQGTTLGAAIFLLVFSLPFAAVGVFMSGLVWREMLESHRILSTWSVTTAAIKSVELESSRGSKGEITYEAKAAYVYAFGDKTETGSRVGLSSGADNVGCFQEKAYHELRAAHDSGRQVPCYVDPSHPASSVLYPRWRPEMGLFKAMFGLVFSAVGFALLAAAILGIRDEVVKKRLRALHPSEPWHWRTDWCAPAIKSDLGGKSVTATVVLLVVQGATLPLWTALPAVLSEAGWFKWLFSAALAVVVAVSVLCARAILRARKYRGARLELDSMPVRPGAACVARLYLPTEIPFRAQLDFDFVCAHLVTTGSGKSRHTTTTKVWEKQQTLQGPFAPGEGIEFRCDVPAGLPSTTTDEGSDRHVWTLKARAHVPGVDLKLEFELPVFRENPEPRPA